MSTMGLLEKLTALLRKSHKMVFFLWYCLSGCNTFRYCRPPYATITEGGRIEAWTELGFLGEIIEWANPETSSMDFLSSSHQFSSVAQSCPTLHDLKDYSMPSLPVHHKPPEFTQTHVHWVSDVIQPSHLLSSPLLPHSIFPSISVFLNESTLHIRWPKFKPSWSQKLINQNQKINERSEMLGI